MTLVALSNAITPKTTGPVVELTGQTLQGDDRPYSGVKAS
jgi:hypothetical protein